MLQGALPGMEEAALREEPAPPKNKSVADRVAARYAKAPTYSEMLAAEARNVARAAEAAVVAAGEARNAAQAILVGLDIGIDDPEEERTRGEVSVSSHSGKTASPVEEPRPAYASSGAPQTTAPPARHPSLITEATDEDDSSISYEDEGPEPAAPVQPLPAKLLEFPRELIAARKARPRLAEGPLREEYDRQATRSQLRIFEVEAETISTEPVVPTVLPEWSPIRLGASPEPASHGAHRRRETEADAASWAHESSSGMELPLQTASLEDRLMAGLVDAALIVGGFLVFVLVFVACTAHPPTGKPALVASAIALFAFASIYCLLFFSFGTDTPGMRYAKIALCTFDDENPTRRAMRRRLAALLLAASPLGLGILWAFFDDDRLGWHDRISRTYQRSYR
jgi:uncharacterized RDD family membrane protein YckC